MFKAEENVAISEDWSGVVFFSAVNVCEENEAIKKGLRCYSVSKLRQYSIQNLL